MIEELVFDLEGDNLYHDITKLWGCGVMQDNGEAMWIENPDEYLDLLTRAKSIIGHNIVGYDLPVLLKMFKWEPKKSQIIQDTMIHSRLHYTHLKSIDKNSTKWDISGKLTGSHSLGAWGIRMGEPKIPSPDFSTWTDEDIPYALQDIVVTKKLWEFFKKKEYSEDAMRNEHGFAKIITRQMHYGVDFDVESAKELYIKLHKDKEKLGHELTKAFLGFWKFEGELTPKVADKKRCYQKGSVLSKIKWVEFSAGSRDHIAIGLKRKYKWKPTKFTKAGNITIDSGVLEDLKKTIPEAEDIDTYLVISKLLGYLGDGKESWLQNEKNGRMYGYVNTNGAVTGRCTHSKPNLGQVPSSRKPYGSECRALFRAGRGRVLLGFDASGLELRGLGHFMAPWDNGQYAKWAAEGTKELGTDPHSVQAKVLGIDRDVEKTWFYAYIYGAGNPKLGAILSGSPKIGGQSKRTIETKIPALGKLTEAVQKASKRGHLVGLDGRLVQVRSSHAALNTLLQSAGAIIMKRALIITDATLQEEHGLIPGIDFEWVLNIHDEYQCDCATEAVAKLIGETCKLSLQLAGEHYGFKCRLDGDYAIGKDWSETH